MIKIFKNPNFPQWFKIEFTDKLGFMDLIDEVNSRALAIKIAKKLAKKEQVKHLCVDGFIAETEEF